DIRRENLFYAEKSSICTIKDHTFYVQPWQPETFLDHKATADVFVGHGFVSGAANNEGYIFNSGFEREGLFERFKVSIIGDIHNGTTIQENGRLILIPGAPIQNSLKDCPVCGFWCVTLDEKGARHKFQSIHEIHEN